LWENVLRVAMVGLLLCGGVGCGGINASHTVTPASFFLPGLGQVTPPPAPAPEAGLPGPAEEAPASNTLTAVNAVQ
jgi:hypothetical protein